MVKALKEDCQAVFSKEQLKIEILVYKKDLRLGLQMGGNSVLMMASKMACDAYTKK